MKNKKITLLLAALLPALFAVAQCTDWESPNKNEQIKVTVWSENDECFRILLDGKELHPDSARQVVFWISGTSMKLQKMTLQIRGQEDQKSLFVNKDMTEVFYRVDKNKKGEYSLKGEPSKAQITPEAQARRDAEQKAADEKRAAEKAQRDKEWEEKMAAQKAEREKAKAEDAQKEAAEKEAKEKELAKKREEENKARGYGGPTTPPATTTTTPGTSSPSSGTSTPAVKNMAKFQGYGIHKTSEGPNEVRESFFYKGRPVANTLITITTRDSIIIGTATTDSEGKAIFKTYFPPGQYVINIYGEKGNATWSIGGSFVLTIQSNPTEYDKTNLDKAIAEMAQAMGMEPDNLARGLGLY
ncbi:MAG: hypothetical protein MUC87_00360 [Bacteroidia bacterium]|jgi:hypothetical protein|nr:hypothetical protein [Bacteroidia bacterium]